MGREEMAIIVAGLAKNSCPNYIPEPSHTPLCQVIGQTLKYRSSFDSRYSSVQVMISRVNICLYVRPRENELGKT